MTRIWTILKNRLAVIDPSTVDVSAPASPTLLASMKSDGGQPSTPYFFDNYVYLPTYDSGFNIIANLPGL